MTDRPFRIALFFAIVIGAIIYGSVFLSKSYYNHEYKIIKENLASKHAQTKRK